MKFLLDTNFLLIPVQFHVDIFSELQNFGKPPFYTLRQVVSELEKLSSDKTKTSRAASLTLLLLKREGVKILSSSSKTADSAIIETAATKNFAVCTQDKALIKKLHSRHVPVVTLRQKKYLIMI